MSRDDTPTLFILGALAYLAAMLLHEAVGHGSLCLVVGGAAVITLTATQCTVASPAMVAAGPLANLIGGLATWALLARASTMPPMRRWFLWLFAACNLFVFAGYLAWGGAADFGDWAVLGHDIQPVILPRAGELLLGALLYYLAIRLLAARQPRESVERLGRLTRLPWIGAGVAAILMGVMNPIGVTQSLILPGLSSLGGLIGLFFVSGIPPAASSTPMPPITRRPQFLVAGLLAILVVAIVFGRGLQL